MKEKEPLLEQMVDSLLDNTMDNWRVKTKICIKYTANMPI